MQCCCWSIFEGLRSNTALQQLDLADVDWTTRAFQQQAAIRNATMVKLNLA
jgi:hypothetical protein